MSVYYDFLVAWDYIEAAAALSEENAFSDLIPYVYMGEVSIYFLADLVAGSRFYEDDMEKAMRKAYALAKEYCSDELILSTIVGNAVEYAVAYGRYQFLSDEIADYIGCVSPADSFRNGFTRMMALGLQSLEKGWYAEVLPVDTN